MATTTATITTPAGKTKVILEYFRILPALLEGEDKIAMGKADGTLEIRLELWRHKNMIATSSWVSVANPIENQVNQRLKEFFNAEITFTPGGWISGPADATLMLYAKHPQHSSPSAALQCVAKQPIPVVCDISKEHPSHDRTLVFAFPSTPLPVKHCLGDAGSQHPKVTQLPFSYTTRMPGPIEGLLRVLGSILGKVQHRQQHGGESKPPLLAVRAPETASLLAGLLQHLLDALTWVDSVAASNSKPLAELLASSDTIQALDEATEYVSAQILGPLVQPLKLLRNSERMGLEERLETAAMQLLRALKRLPTKDRPVTASTTTTATATATAASPVLDENRLVHTDLPAAKAELRDFATGLKTMEDCYFSESQREMRLEAEEKGKKLDKEIQDALKEYTPPTAGDDNDDSHWRSVLMSMGTAIAPILKIIPFGSLLVNLAKKIFIGFMKAAEMRNLSRKIGERVCLLLTTLQDAPVTKLIIENANTKKYLMYVYMCIESIQDTIEEFSSKTSVGQWWTSSEAVTTLQGHHGTLCELFSELHHSVSLQFMARTDAKLDAHQTAIITLLKAGEQRQHNECFEIQKQLQELRQSVTTDVTKLEKGIAEKLTGDVKELETGLVSKLTKVVQDQLRETVSQQQDQGEALQLTRKEVQKLHDDIDNSVITVNSSMLENLQALEKRRADTEANLFTALHKALEGKFNENEALQRQLSDETIQSLKKVFKTATEDTTVQLGSLRGRIEELQRDAAQAVLTALRNEARESLRQMKSLNGEAQKHLEQRLLVHENKLLGEMRSLDFSAQFRQVSQGMVETMVKALKDSLLPNFGEICNLITSQTGKLEGVDDAVKQLHQTIVAQDAQLLDSVRKSNSDTAAAALKHMDAHFTLIESQCRELRKLDRQMAGMVFRLQEIAASQKQIQGQISSLGGSQDDMKKGIAAIQEQLETLSQSDDTALLSLKAQVGNVGSDVKTIGSDVSKIKATLQASADAAFNTEQLRQLHGFFQGTTMIILAANQAMKQEVIQEFNTGLDSMKNLLIENAAFVGSRLESQCASLLHSMETAVIHQIASKLKKCSRQQTDEINRSLKSSEHRLSRKLDTVQAVLVSELGKAEERITQHILDLGGRLDQEKNETARQRIIDYGYSIKDDETLMKNHGLHPFLPSDFLRHKLKEAFRSKHQHTKTAMGSCKALKLLSEKMYTQLMLFSVDDKDKEKIQVHRFDADKLLDQKLLKAEEKVLLIEGRAGIGKTTFAIHAACQQCFSGCFTFMVRLSEVALHLRTSGAKQMSAMQMMSLAIEHEKQGVHPSDLRILEYIWVSGEPIVWLMDGFDEVQGLNDPAMNKFLHNFLVPEDRRSVYTDKDSYYKHTVRRQDIVIITSREERNSNYNFRSTPVLFIEKWKMDQAKDYVERFFEQAATHAEYRDKCSLEPCTIEGKQTTEREYKEERVLQLMRPLGGFATLPIMCEMLCYLSMCAPARVEDGNELTVELRSPPKVFESAIEQLCNRRATATVKVNVQEILAEGSNRAFQMFLSGDVNLTISGCLNGEEASQQDPLIQVGLCRPVTKTPTSYTVQFIHKSFLEYLVARYYAANIRKLAETKIVQVRVHQDWQQGTLRVYSPPKGFAQVVSSVFDKGWHDRFCIYNPVECNISCYENEKAINGEKAVCIIDLDENSLVLRPTAMDHPAAKEGSHQFLVKLSGDAQPFLAQTKSAQECKFWVDAIQSTVSGLHGSVQGKKRNPVEQEIMHTNAVFVPDDEKVEHGIKLPTKVIQRQVPVVDVSEDSQDRNMLLLLGYMMQGGTSPKGTVTQFCEIIAGAFSSKVRILENAYPRSLRVDPTATVENREASPPVSPLSASVRQKGLDSSTRNMLFQHCARYCGLSLIVELSTIIHPQLLQAVDGTRNALRRLVYGQPCFYYWIFESCGRFDAVDALKFVQSKLGDKEIRRLSQGRVFDEALLASASRGPSTEIEEFLREDPFNAKLDFDLACSLGSNDVVRTLLAQAPRPEGSVIINGIQKAFQSHQYETLCIVIDHCHVQQPKLFPDVMASLVKMRYPPDDSQWKRFVRSEVPQSALRQWILSGVSVFDILDTTQNAALSNDSILKNVALFCEIFVTWASNHPAESDFHLTTEDVVLQFAIAAIKRGLWAAVAAILCSHRWQGPLGEFVTGAVTEAAGVITKIESSFQSRGKETFSQVLDHCHTYEPKLFSEAMVSLVKVRYPPVDSQWEHLVRSEVPHSALRKWILSGVSVFDILETNSNDALSDDSILRNVALLCEIFILTPKVAFTFHLATEDVVLQFIVAAIKRGLWLAVTAILCSHRWQGPLGEFVTGAFTEAAGVITKIESSFQSRGKETFSQVLDHCHAYQTKLFSETMAELVKARYPPGDSQWEHLVRSEIPQSALKKWILSGVSVFDILGTNSSDALSNDSILKNVALFCEIFIDLPAKQHAKSDFHLATEDVVLQFALAAIKRGLWVIVAAMLCSHYWQGPLGVFVTAVVTDAKGVVEKIGSSFQSRAKEAFSQVLKHAAKLGGEHPISLDSVGMTPLLVAAGEGLLDVIEFINAGGWGLNDKSTMLGMTALLLAAKNGHLDTIKYLLANGATVTERNNGGNTALHFAAGMGHLDIVKYLLVNGASLIEKNNLYNQDTPLLLAAKNGHLDTIKYLLANGATVTEKNEDGTTALLLAAMNGHLDTIKYLLANGATVTAKNSNGWTPLLSAARNGHLDTVKYLLANGANLAEKDCRGDTALLHAAWYDHLDTVKYLLANGATLAEKDYYGRTALLLAAGKGRLDTVKYLLANGASVAEKNDKGWTPLHFAVLCGHDYGGLDTVKYLLANGANLAEKNDDGMTALLSAASNGHLHIVQCLLDNGASLAEKNNSGYTALLLAAEMGHFDTVKCILANGASLSERSSGGYTALLLAARNEHLDTVKYVLANGASLTEKTKDGYTALLLAAREGHLRAVKYLVANGASFDEKSNEGKTARDYCVGSNNPELVAVAKASN